jgi:hypothetical protein
MLLADESGWFDGKNGGKKSHATVPLTQLFYCLKTLFTFFLAALKVFNSLPCNQPNLKAKRGSKGRTE